MIKNLISSALRSLLKNRIYAFVNICGLAVGITAAIVLSIFAIHELSYDRFHQNADNIFLMYKERITPNGVQPTYDTWVPLLEQMLADFPEIKSGTRLFNENSVIEAGEQKFSDQILYADTTFLDVFSFVIEKGNSKDPFPTINTALLTPSAATRYFGNDDPIGKQIRVNYTASYTVSGVISAIPENSSIQGDLIIPIASHPAYERVAKSWGSSFLSTYVLLDERSGPGDMEAKFPGFIEKIWDEETRNRTNFRMLPLLDSYDTFIGDSRDAYILLYIAAGILMISAINFMNLATAGSTDRSREIGMRKVMGSNKFQIVSQFMVESLLITIIAMVLGVAMAKVVFPWLNQIFGMGMALDLTSSSTLLILLGFLLFVALISGGYPAFFISNFRILDSLQGTFQAGGGLLRKFLVVIQFALSVMLITGTLVVFKQIRFMKNADMSYNHKNLLVIPVSADDFEDEDDASIRLETFRNELLQHSQITSISTSTHVPSRWSGSNVFVRPEGWNGDPLRMRYTYHDARFFETYGINLMEGEGFLPDGEGNQRQSVVLNAAAMIAFGFEDISEKAIMIGDTKIEVVGAIENFNYETLREQISPILHFHRISSNGVHRYITLRFNPDNYSEVMTFINDKWQVLSDVDPLEYFFIEDSIAEMYASEDRMLKMTTAFSMVAIFVASLGLFGLSSFMIEKRRKEIGIRKVLGASVFQVVGMVSISFGVLIIIAVGLAVPLSYYLMNAWLQGFAYATSIDVFIYLVSLTFVILAGWVAVSYTAFKAATTNPVHAIKEE